jgi:hypothetical protein
MAYSFTAGERTQRTRLHVTRAQRREALARLESLARVLDTAIRIPGLGIRLGADALIGLAPGIGDAVTALLAGWIVYQAHRLGAPRRLLVKMLGNVAVDGLVGAVPLVGDAFDVLWRANRRNVRLLREHFEREGAI